MQSTKRTTKRILSFVLALVMVLSMIPAVHTHAAEASLKITNSAGEETDTFVAGEPIYVETTGYTSNQWLDLWYVKPDGSYESNYRLWWYASDEKMLLWDAVWEESIVGWDGMDMPAGKYEIYLESKTLLQTFTLVEPDATVAAQKSLAVAVDGNKVSINAINYSEYSQVSITNASGVEMYQFFCLGRNGLTMETELIPGEYTISMYNDYYKQNLYTQQKITVEGEKVELLTTDKTEYKFGEPIYVTSQYGNPYWVGLYKQDDANPTTQGPTSLYWLHPTVGQAVNILSGEVQRASEFVAGTYKVLLLDANYNIVAYVENITITTEIDENKTVTVDATCEKDGSVTYYNTDGTVAKVETLTALGHDYSEMPAPVDGVVGKHVYTCVNDGSHTKQEDCDWDDGEVTTPAGNGKEGVMTYTCYVCCGTKTEVIPAKEVVREVIDKEATCEEAGSKHYVYTDDTTSDPIEIPALGHSYGDWVYNSETKQHSKTCANDEKHVVTEVCSFESDVVDGGTRYTCSVCGGYYDVIILSTDKTEYALGEPILVTVDTSAYDETATDWIGIWENDWTYTNDVSIYYYYPSAQGWTDFNIYNSAYYQRGSVGVGTYTIRLFANDGYTEITNVTITVGPAVLDESKTVKTDPTCTEDGYITYTYTDGTTKVEYPDDMKATGHSYSKWTSNNDGKTHSQVCANNKAHVNTASCTWGEGEQTKAPTTTEAGVMTYTCSVCGGTKTEAIPATGAEETGRVAVDPTCTQEGYTLITYSDGSTKKVDVKAALGHDYTGVEWVHVDGTRTHARSCSRNCGEEGATETANCVLETNAVQSQYALYYSCGTCGEWYEPIILTDKKVYTYGEEIVISVHPDYAAGMSATDWIGLYKVGETPNGNWDPTSIYWGYVSEFEGGKSIFKASHNDRPNDYTAGEYVLYLCKNDGYEIAGRVYITVVAEETERVTTAPTCTEDGYITAYYNDGTSKVVVTAEDDETLKAHGHTYGDWSYNGIEKQTHTHSCVCTACGEACTASETQACEWDEGKVTQEATTEQTGIKTYTCNVCGGTKEEVLPKVNVTVTGTVTVEATCEEPGYIRTSYSDGTYTDEVIPAKGHAYGEWTYDAATRSHNKICDNDASHVITEACTMEKLVVDNSVNYTCSVCEGGYVTGLVETDKLVYGVTDPIMVTVHATYSGAWVGLYKEGEQFDPTAGGIESLFWSYITADMVGKAFDLTAVTAGLNSGHRGEKLSNGKYVLVFFGDSGYSNVINRVEIEVYTDMSNTEFDLLFYKGESRENGYHIDFELKDVDNPAGGEKVTLGVNATGEVGSSWVGVFEGNYNLNTEFDGMVPKVKKYIADINGKTPFSLNWASEGGFDFYVGDFTIVIFADAGYDYPVKYVTFTVYRPIVDGSEVILRNPSCETPGLKMVDYEDDNNPDTVDKGVMVEIPALGHKYGEWEHVENTNTHSRTCTREGCGDVETVDCTFENGACTVCGAAQHIHELTKVDAKEATCTEGGHIAYYTCSCGKWFKDAAAQELIEDHDSVNTAVKAHTYDQKVADEKYLKTAASCTTAAEYYLSCTCGAKGTETFTYGSALGHKWSDATCETPATCSVCGNINGSALGHSYGKWVYNAETKTHTKCCSNDAAHTVTENCVFGDAVVIKNAVGNNAGQKQYTCSTCGGTYIEEFYAKIVDGSYERIYGADRYLTAIAAAEQLKANLGIEKFQTIVVACGTDFADALSGSYLANQKNAPILLVRNNAKTMEKVKEYIKNNLAAGGTVYLLGGEKAIPKTMETGLDGFNVKRLAGATRYETNLAILKEAGYEGKDILVCTGEDFADGLSASALNMPILLVKNKLTDAQTKLLETVSGKIYIVGGTNAVNTRIENALKEYGTTERISGRTRYETSVNIAKKFFGTTKYAVMAYGGDFPDGLSAGPVAYSMGAPVILIAAGKTDFAQKYMTGAGITTGTVVGGTAVLADKTVALVLG